MSLKNLQYRRLRGENWGAFAGAAGVNLCSAKILGGAVSMCTAQASQV
jgi:hypothetical protein